MPLSESRQGEVERGRAFQIIDVKHRPDRPSSFELKKEMLEYILKDIGNRPVHLLSIAGASKQGKSFLMTIIVNLLARMECSGSIDDAWEDFLKSDIPFPAFDFENGIDRTTIGFWMWSKPFILRKTDGTEFALLLMDTQGVFDKYTNERDWATIVGLSVLTSSTMIYNLMNNFHEDTLTILKNFLEFGMLIMKDDNNLDSSPAFEKLIFLIRDWTVPDSCNYGTLGGNQLLSEKLKLTPTMARESKDIRELIKACFRVVDCFLLPTPGQQAITNHYKGQLSELDKLFLTNLMAFTQELLDPDTLPTSKRGQPFKPKMLVSTFERYIQAFNAIKLPQPKTLIQLSQEANAEFLTEKLFERLRDKIQRKLESVGFFDPSWLANFFKEIYTEAIKAYQAESVKNIKSEAIREKYYKVLHRDLVAIYHQLLGDNERRETSLFQETSAIAHSVYIEIIESALSRNCLLPEEFENARRAAECGALDAIRNHLHKCPTLLQKFEEDILPQLSVRGGELKVMNEKKLSIVQDKIADISNSLLETYVNNMTFVKLNSSQLSLEKLEKIHSVSAATAIQKLAEAARSLPELTNKGILEKETNNLKNRMLDALEVIASEVREQCRGVELKCEAALSAMIEKFKATCLRLAQTHQKGDIETQFLLQQSVCSQELLSQLATTPERIPDYMAKAKLLMDDCITLARNKLKEMDDLKEEKISGIVEHCSRAFQEQLGLLMEQTFEDENEMNQKVSKIRQSILEDAAHHSAQFNEKSCKDKMQFSLQKKMENTAEKFTQDYIEQEEEFLSDLRSSLHITAKEHEKALSQLIQTDTDKGRLEDFHKRKVLDYINHFEKHRKVSNKSLQTELEVFLNYLEKTFEFASQRLASKMKEIVVEIQSQVDSCFDMYVKEVNVRCKEFSSEENYLSIQQGIQERALSYFSSIIHTKTALQEKKKHTTILLSKIEQHSREWMKSMEEKRDRETAKVVRLKENLLSEFKIKSESALRKHKNQHDVNFAVHEFMYDTLGDFENQFPSDSTYRVREEWRAFKPRLEEVRENTIREFQDAQFKDVSMADQIAVEYKSFHNSKICQQLFPNGSKTAVQEDDLLNIHSKIQLEIKQNIEQRTDLSSHQKETLLQKLRPALKENFDTFTRENDQELENYRRKLDSLFIKEETKLRELRGHIRTKEHFAALLEQAKNNINAQATPELLGISVNLMPDVSARLAVWGTEMSQFGLTQFDGAEEVEGLIRNCKDIYHAAMTDMTRDGNYMHPQNLEECHRNACSRVKQQKLQDKKTNIQNGILDSLNLAFKRYIDENDMRKSTLDGIAIGIDLGTTYSCAGVYRNGGVEMIPNELSSFITPSYILYRGDEVVVGKTAKDQAVSYPGLVVFDAKRLIGRKITDKITQEDMKLWPFQVVSEDKLRPKIKIGTRTLFPEQVSSEVLKKLKTDAEKYLHADVQKAVITVPAYFTDAQKKATRDAGEIAGLTVLGIISEPTSAAIAYSLSYTDEISRSVFVYDLGGGTFDVSVLQICRGNVEVKAVGGDNHLGGQDFDNAMLNHCVKVFKDATGIDLSHGKGDIVDGRLRRIRHICEQEKIHLSSTNTTRVVAEAIDGKNNLNVEFTQGIFNDLNAALFQKTIDICHKALQDARLEPNAIDEVVLVGGSTRIPAVKQRLQEMFQNRNLQCRLNPDEVVARGAAVYAAMLNGKQARHLGHIQFTDVAPLSLGIKTVGDIFSVILRRNAKIPTAEVKPYYTAEENQTTVDIEIFEGEDRVASNNNLLGKFSLSGIPKAPKGKEKIEVKMELNKEGILKVTAVASSTGGKHSVNVRAIRTNLTEEEKMLLT